MSNIFLLNWSELLNAVKHDKLSWFGQMGKISKWILHDDKTFATSDADDYVPPRSLKVVYCYSNYLPCDMCDHCVFFFFRTCGICTLNLDNQVCAV